MCPQLCWQEPDEGREDGAVGSVEPGPRLGAAQHGDLMSQHEQLGVLGGSWPAEQDQPAAEPDEDEVERRRDTDDHDALRLTLDIAAARRACGLLAPYKVNGYESVTFCVAVVRITI